MLAGQQQAASSAGGLTLEQVKEAAADAVQDAIAELGVSGDKAAAGTAATDEAALRKIVADALRTAKPDRIVLDGKVQVAMKQRTHPLFEKVLRLVKSGVNVLLVGPAGCGKTMLAHHVA